MQQPLAILVFAALCLGSFPELGPAQNATPAPALAPVPAEHVLAGAWLADDGTVFIFRADGTFHGFDYTHKEIWGNWVTLSPSRIGFQSLLHNASYLPQYAIIDKTDRDAMDYIVTRGSSFIHAKRIPLVKAEDAVEVVVEPQVQRPGERKTE